MRKLLYAVWFIGYVLELIFAFVWAICSFIIKGVQWLLNITQGWIDTMGYDVDNFKSYIKTGKWLRHSS